MRSLILANADIHKSKASLITPCWDIYCMSMSPDYMLTCFDWPCLHPLHVHDMISKMHCLWHDCKDALCSICGGVYADLLCTARLGENCNSLMLVAVIRMFKGVQMDFAYEELEGVCQVLHKGSLSSLLALIEGLLLQGWGAHPHVDFMPAWPGVTPQTLSSQGLGRYGSKHGRVLSVAALEMFADLTCHGAQ